MMRMMLKVYFRLSVENKSKDSSLYHTAQMATPKTLETMEESWLAGCSKAFSNKTGTWGWLWREKTAQEAVAWVDMSFTNKTPIQGLSTCPWCNPSKMLKTHMPHLALKADHFCVGIHLLVLQLLHLPKTDLSRSTEVLHIPQQDLPHLHMVRK